MKRLLASAATIPIPLGTVATSMSFNSSPPQSLPYSQRFPARRP